MQLLTTFFPLLSIVACVGLPMKSGDTLRREIIADDLKSPWAIAFLSDAEALIPEKEGGLVRVRLDDGTKTQITGLPSDLVDDIRGEVPFDNGGLFDVAIGPNFDENPWVYLSYAAKSDLPIAQDPSDRRGKIYRLNPDGSIPGDNPDFGPAAVPGLYAIGVRAAQGITLHPITGDIWFSEHGSTQGDEINRLGPGANYGWPIVTTGGYRNDDFSPPDLNDRTFTPPFWWWPQTVAPTGFVFYQGDEFPEWRGDLFVSGLGRRGLRRMNFEGGQIVSVEEIFVNDRIRSRDIAVATNGALYMLADTLLRPKPPKPEGGLEYTKRPGGRLRRILR